MIDEISRIIAHYDSEGVHRTATREDNASADWLVESFHAMGVSAFTEPFDTERVDIIDASLHLDGLTIDGVTAFDCHYTDETGISGRLGLPGSEADIAVITALPFDSAPGQQQALALRREGRHRAVLVITDPGMPDTGPALVNAEHFREPFGPPVLQVSNRHRARLLQAASDGEQATLIAHAKRVSAKALNVGAEIWGSKASLAPIVVMTPRSGWWHCAAERGGGIAVLLLIAGHFMQHPPVRNVIFTANTGHELGHTGLDHFLEQNPALAREAHAFLHLGANFVAKDTVILLQYGSKHIESISGELMRQHALSVANEIPPGRRPLGEARNIFDSGGRYLSILGSNPLFHHPEDRWPDAIDLSSAVRCAHFLVAAADRLANEPD